MSTHEFRLGLAEVGHTRYPASFVWGVKTAAADDDAFRLIESRVREEFRAALTPAKKAALVALAKPIYQIDISGCDVSKDIKDPSHYVRVHAYWAGDDDAFIAQQLPGPEVGAGGDVRVTRTDVASWTRGVAALIPGLAGPGRLPTDSAVEFDQESLGDAKLAVVAATAPKSTAAAAFRHMMPALCGQINLNVHAVDGTDRRWQMELRWHDIPDDGRYLLVVDEVGVAMGVSATTLAKTMNRVFNTLKRRRDAAAAGSQG
ncbi:hypothetical protein [Williamsia sp. CHRR-6]|uniref:hypothetical protein n=1 Tax=Williamsia sp. CHRR-6 TaxID=2835871 RepID=UPI001BDA03B9|nr:hypothetical protein [Williamsia sp. CHRR-6]MBT0567662.1 hypothetical protein [Williamsia sp. CHRR-6]